MKRILIFLALLSPLALWAQPKNCIPVRSGDDLPYAPGEKLSYALSYNWHAVATDVASAYMLIDTTRFEGNAAWHALLSAKSAAFFDIFFKVRERFDSWFLPGVRPLKFIRDTHEGSYFAWNLYQYDPAAGIIHTDLDSQSAGKRQVDLPYGDCTFDLPALLYFTRNMDISSLSEGQTYHITFAIDEDIQVLNLTFKGRERKYVKGVGTIACMKFGCSVMAGEMFEGNEDAILWISDDDNRIPVYFYAPLRVGGVAGRLTAYQGLAHDFTSFISRKKVK